MKIQPKRKLYDVDGEKKAIKNGEEEMTVGFAITFVLNQDKAFDPLLAFKIMKKVNRDEEVELSTEQRNNLRDSIINFSKQPNRHFGNNVWGQLIAILENDEDAERTVTKSDKPGKKK